MSSPNKQQIKIHQKESEIVQDLFHNSIPTITTIGTVISSVTSSYQRQQGRFYICTNVICFYSNVLGLERKLCIPIVDLISISIIRNTSILFKCRSKEMKHMIVMAEKDHHYQQQQEEEMVVDYIFRSFRDRLAVMEMIRKIYFDITGGSNLHVDTILQSHAPHGVTTDETHSVDMSSHKKVLEGIIPPSPLSVLTPYENKLDTSHPIAIPPTQFRISIDEYYETFLANNAPKSMSWFQSNILGDQVTECTPWEEKTPQEWTRHFKALHHRKQKVGPSKVSITRQQNLIWNQNPICITLNTSLILEGVPYSDCFWIEDEWIVSSVGESCVEMVVRYRVHFIKKTIMKKVIMKQAEDEIMKWFHAYLKMLKDELEGGKEAVGYIRHEKSNEENCSNEFYFKCIISLIFVIGLVLGSILGGILLKMQKLEELLNQYHLDHEDVMKFLKTLEDEVHNLWFLNTETMHHSCPT